jgi:(E)-4-hydroxy-3-methylbut-2-enyl-diphosphate synthase
MNYPIHIGVTATGLSDTGLVKSSIGIGTLLTEGIGDTIRVSLTSSSIKEIEVAKQILQSLEIKRFVPEIISCPTCGRCQVDLLKIAKQIKEEIDKMAQKYKKLNFLKIAVMGCEVNGPGEARAADIGVACGKDRASLFKKGKVIRTIKAKNIKKELLEEISNEMV